MADKFLRFNLTTKEWEISEGVQTSAGSGDAGKLAKLNASGYFDSTLLPPGVGEEAKTMTTSEAVTAGNLVNIHDDTGAKVRKADASGPSPKPAHGFVTASAAMGETVKVYPVAFLAGLSGMTIGAKYFLAKTPGGITTDVSGYVSGDLIQEVGFMYDTDTLSFRPGFAAKLA